MFTNAHMATLRQILAHDHMTTYVQITKAIWYIPPPTYAHDHPTKIGSPCAPTHVNHATNLRGGRPRAIRKQHHHLPTPVTTPPVLLPNSGSDGIGEHRPLGFMYRLIPTTALQHFAHGSGITAVFQATKMKLLRNAHQRKEKDEASLADADLRAAALMVLAAKRI